MATQYDWGTATKPAAPIADQLYVDNLLRVWEWNPTNTAWERAEYVMKRTKEGFILTANSLAGSDVLQARASWWTMVWDRAFALSFIEVVDVTNGVVLGRRAHMSRSQLLTWLGTVIPLSAGRYDRSIMLRVYDLVDPRKEFGRWNAWNGIYGSFRGRDCYTGQNGFGRQTLPGLGGYSPEFAAWHGVNLELLLMNYFYSMTPGSSEPRACWATNNRRNLYRNPKQDGSVSPILQSTQPWKGRYVWDWGSSSWGPSLASEDFSMHFTGGLSDGNPCFVFRNVDSNSIQIGNVVGELFGTFGVLGDNQEGVEGMICHLMQSNADPNRVGFMFKPYGISKAAFQLSEGITLTDYDVIAVGEYKDVPRDPMYFVPTGAQWIEQRGGGDGIRLNSLPYLVRQLGNQLNNASKNQSIDTSGMVNKVRFILRNKTTGLQSPISPFHVATQYRKCGIPISLIMRRG